MDRLELAMKHYHEDWCSEHVYEVSRLTADYIQGRSLILDGVSPTDVDGAIFMELLDFLEAVEAGNADFKTRMRKESRRILERKSHEKTDV